MRMYTATSQSQPHDRFKASANEKIVRDFIIFLAYIVRIRKEFHCARTEMRSGRCRQLYIS